MLKPNYALVIGAGWVVVADNEENARHCFGSSDGRFSFSSLRGYHIQQEIRLGLVFLDCGSDIEKNSFVQLENIDLHHSFRLTNDSHRVLEFHSIASRLFLVS